jgi:hypothetical protein
MVWTILGAARASSLWRTLSTSFWRVAFDLPPNSTLPLGCAESHELVSA